MPGNATVSRDLDVIGGALNRLVRLGVIEANPVKRVRKAKEERRRRAMLGQDEVRRLVLACDDWLRPLVLAAVRGTLLPEDPIAPLEDDAAQVVSRRMS